MMANSNKQLHFYKQICLSLPYYIVIILGLLITKEISKLIFKNNIKQAVFATMINLISTGIIIYLTLHKALWNEKFMNNLIQSELITKNSEKYHVIQTIWEQFTDRKSTRLNSSHVASSYAVFCLKKQIQSRED